MTAYAQQERQALADLMDAVGPDAPTLCEGWSTADLAAHLIIRERRPDAGVGILVPPLSAYSDRVQRSVRDGTDWTRLVDRVRTGPPLLLRPVDELVNAVEYFVHHEDVRRGSGSWAPRNLPADEEHLLWSRLKRMGKLLVRRSPVGVRLDAGGEGAVTLKSGPSTVMLSGPPSELVMYCYGRREAARVDLSGDDSAIDLLKSASLGL